MTDLFARSECVAVSRQHIVKIDSAPEPRRGIHKSFAFQAKTQTPAASTTPTSDPILGLLASGRAAVTAADAAQATSPSEVSDEERKIIVACLAATGAAIKSRMSPSV